MRRNQRTGMGAVDFLGAVVLILIAAFAFYYYVNNHAENSKRTLTIKRLVAVETALEKYCVDCGGRLPTAEQGLEALLERPQQKPIPQAWAGPYLSESDAINDGWGRPFKYLCPGRPVAPGSDIMRPCDLASYGRDGSEGGRGLDRDICNWDRATMVP